MEYRVKGSEQRSGNYYQVRASQGTECNFSPSRIALTTLYPSERNPVGKVALALRFLGTAFLKSNSSGPADSVTSARGA
jgi:hypothetical protein